MQFCHAIPASGEYPDPPPPLRLPKLVLWLKARGLTVVDAATALKLSRTTLEFNLRAADDPAYRTASVRTRYRVKAWTKDEVGLEDWPEKIELPSAPEVSPASVQRGEGRACTPRGRTVGVRVRKARRPAAEVGASAALSQGEG